MDIELTGQLAGPKKAIWKAFLARADLEADEQVESTVLIWEAGKLIATGSRQKGLLKCIAVDDMHQGEGLTATLLTQLRQDAFRHGYSHLFLYTKPKNELMFSSLFFYPIAKTDQVLLMENKKDGIRAFLNTLPVSPVRTPVSDPESRRRMQPSVCFCVIRGPERILCIGPHGNGEAGDSRSSQCIGAAHRAVFDFRRHLPYLFSEGSGCRPASTLPVGY